MESLRYPSSPSLDLGSSTSTSTSSSSSAAGGHRRLARRITVNISTAGSTKVTSASTPASANGHVPLWQKMAVGGTAGVIGTVSVFPIDTVKTRLQLATCTATGSTHGATGITAVVADVWSRSGIRGLYRGLPATALGTMPEKAIKLGVNDFLRDVLCGYDRSKETLENQMAAGALTAGVQVVATNPLEIVKLRLQSANGALTPTQAIRELGPRGLYKGGTVTLIRDVPYNIIFFLSYIKIKEFLTNSETGHVSRQGILASGVSAGMLAAFAGTPCDVVKSRIQARNSTYTNGALDCAKRLYREGGVGAFFRGALPRMAVQGPLYGIALLSFEIQTQYLSR